jgi:hypothetical protein
LKRWRSKNRGMMRGRERVQVLKSIKVLLRPCSMLCIQDHHSARAISALRQTARRSAVHRESVENCDVLVSDPKRTSVSCAHAASGSATMVRCLHRVSIYVFSPNCPLELYTFVENLNHARGQMRGSVNVNTTVRQR